MGIRTALTMLYGRRVVQQPPPPSQKEAEVLDQRLPQIPEHVIAGRAGPRGIRNRLTSYYPSDRLAADAMQFVSSLERSSVSGTSGRYPAAIQNDEVIRQWPGPQLQGMSMLNLHTCLY